MTSGVNDLEPNLKSLNLLANQSQQGEIMSHDRNLETFEVCYYHDSPTWYGVHCWYPRAPMAAQRIIGQCWSNPLTWQRVVRDR
jgi:hypothetical protein